MTSASLDRVGSWTSLFIGLPLGVLFSFAVLYISLLPMLDFGVAIIGGGLFWHPIIWGGIIPLSYAILLWRAGKRIKGHLDKNYTALKTSFLFTLFVNSWLFGLLLSIFILGGLFFNIEQTISFGNISIVAIGLTILTFIIATALTTVTIGLLIVIITRSKINKERQINSF